MQTRGETGGEAGSQLLFDSLKIMTDLRLIVFASQSGYVFLRWISEFCHSKEGDTMKEVGPWLDSGSYCVILTSVSTDSLLFTSCNITLIFKPWDNNPVWFALPCRHTDRGVPVRVGLDAMEQYTANSNSSTEQIVVQAGQIQQQVREAVTGEQMVPAPSDKAVCAPQTVRTSQMYRDAVCLRVHLTFVTSSVLSDPTWSQSK